MLGDEGKVEEVHDKQKEQEGKSPSKARILVATYIEMVYVIGHVFTRGSGSNPLI